MIKAQGITAVVLAFTVLLSISAHAAGAPDVVKFCSDPNRKMPAAGKQFDGKPADQQILDLKEGMYTLPGDGSVQIYKEGYFTLKKPKNIITFFGASRNNGGELLTAGDTMSGCSKEQLSEIMRRNKLSAPVPAGTSNAEPTLVPGGNYLPVPLPPDMQPKAPDAGQ